MMQSGYITEIQRSSVHDGPGLRSVVFLKGCNLHCYWCHNPEAIAPGLQLSFDAGKCLGCLRCLKSCPCQAHAVVDSQHVINRSRCNLCFQCVHECYSGALSVNGKKITVHDVLMEVLIDREFYATSGGGVTLSGGEPTLQPKFAYEILKQCQDRKIHTAIETNLVCSKETIEFFLPVVDLFMADLKIMDSELHRKATGVKNQNILDNILFLGQNSKPLILRTPVIPGFNDNVNAIAACADFASKISGLLYYELLAYHPLGCHKAELIGEKQTQLEMIPHELWLELIAAAKTYPITVWADGRKR